MTTITGYYNGNQIVMNEDVSLNAGQEVLITILEPKNEATQKIDFGKFVGRGEKMLDIDAQEYINQLRSNDRI